jgi:hypothetical protein
MLSRDVGARLGGSPNCLNLQHHHDWFHEGGAEREGEKAGGRASLGSRM